MKEKKMSGISQRRVSRWTVVWLIAAAFVLGAPQNGWSFTSADANTIMNSYNNAFLKVNTSANRAIYRSYTGTDTTADFWKFANEIEMLMDAYDRTGSSTYRTLITQLCNGFTTVYGTSWSNNSFNDDVMWASIAFARAYKKTGNTSFRSIAKSNFDMCYARAWDTSTGGLWWTTGKTSKTSAVNGPGAIAAFNLYEVLGDSNYRTRSQTIFNWCKANLWNSGTGQVYDSTSNFVPTSYNQGTFVGAAHYLGDVTSATLAANYTKNSMGSSNSTTGGHRLLPTYPHDGDGAGFNGICLRWIAKFMKDRGLQGSYLAWMQANANAAWNRRRTSDNLSWCRWHENTPTGRMYSFGCSSSVVALQVTPP
jgi:predicted alpha-1,6-mannanase (GH76 family)